MDSLILATVLVITSFVLYALVFVLLLSDDVDLELRLARFEQLIARRPLLLNSVLLRQNPHNVHEWHKRVKLYEGNPRQVRYNFFQKFLTETLHMRIKQGCHFFKKMEF